MSVAPLGYSDLWTTEDELGFGASVAALVEVVGGAELRDTPLTVGIYGPWGSGKTSMMRMMCQTLDDRTRHPGVLPIWFDAWRYAQSEALWRALLISVVEEIRTHVVQDDDRLRTLVGKHAIAAGQARPADLKPEREKLEQRLDDMIAGLYRTVEREELGSVSIDWPEVGKAAVGTAVRLGLAAIPFVGTVQKALEEAVKAAQGKLAEGEDATAFAQAIRRERAKIYRDQVRSLEQFYSELKELIEAWAEQAGYRLVIFIDDLDRCLPDQALGVLEAIKVFFDARGCVFVLGVDHAIIERGIRIRYKEFALSERGAAPGAFPVPERDYLEKIVQIPFALPPLAQTAIHEFLGNRLPKLPGLSDDEATSVAKLMSAGLLPNPRKVKRSFNIFRLHLILDRAQGRTTPAGLIAKLTVIQSSFPDLYEKIARDPTLLRTYEAIARGITIPKPITQEQREDMGKQDARLRDMLHNTPWYEKLSNDELHELIYQSSVTIDGNSPA
ncbi:AAA family ATPase [Candidatus Chloroploca sp. M-50]|uniref:AAA family ATPase n=1 Tax=Candidatus Chloroploca mongolica TaxID=2528176 RepID=A0ABS4DA02_9CHLR|nr:P-loop NTPase fold protein [Candidatus Chloroploca mongolica]MBP1466274.1 AAA family ATPase [Candidatus Chloroploca mongolica]